MKILIVLFLSIGLSANMFSQMGLDQMREQFVDQVEEMTETSDLPLSEEKHEVLEEREKRIEKNQVKKEKELARMRANTDKMHARIAEKDRLKQEVRSGGNTYLGITLNMRTDEERSSKYLGLDRSWTKRSNTNGVGVVSLSGIVSKEDVIKFHTLVKSKYTFVNTKSYKTPEMATTAYFYENKGDSIIFSVHTTEYNNPVMYRMVIEYTSREEVQYRKARKNNKEKINQELDTL